MATTARQPKPQRKGMPEPAARRPTAWTGARASPTYSPSTPNARLPNGASSAATSGAFPPLGNTNSAGSTPPPRTSGDAPHDRVLAQLSGLVGTTITLSTKTHQRYEGSIASTSGEGDTTGVTLRDVKDLTTSGTPLREQLFIAATNIEQWSSGPADSKAPASQPAVNGDTFKTDVDISKATALRRERDLQAWQPSEEPGASASASASTSPPQLNNALRDELTFGPGAGGSWDQFAANEKLFGVRAGFDEEAYTTRLDRNAPNFKERERRAAAIANEILQSSTSNPHIAEERKQNLVGDSGTNEEEKYGAVVRSVNAYVPPGARKGNAGAPTKPEKQELPKVSVEAPDGSSVPTDKVGTSTSTTAGAIPPKAGSPAPAAGAKPSADDAFREFVSSEKDRLMKRKQVLMKNEMDKRMAELVKFSKSFKLNKPIPEDLVPILAKDEEKQRQIREKSTKDAESSNARAIGTSTTITASATVARLPGASNPPGSAKPPAAQPAIAKAAAAGAQKLADQAKSGEGKRVSMYIQPIPAFKGKRSSAAPTPAAGAGARPPSGGANAVGNGPLSPTAANRLNVNASSFRPNPKSVSPSGPSPGVNGSSSSPKPKQAEGAASPQTQGPPNPFFGTRIPKKAPPVHIKDDFNPFKYNKVVDAAQVAPTWPYSGKRYMQMFPPLQAQPQQQSPPMAHPPPPQMPPQSYEEDTAAQAAAARGYVYAYPPYAYPGQYPQPMMPGMAPPPPGAYMPAPPPFMQPMPYPMPPNAMYPAGPMGQMPPPQAYMQQAPPPGAYPVPPNGAGPRPSMPPTPIPSHAHPYYQQSPQMQHAVPYPMMMPPPGPQPHPYDGSQAPPVPMGGVGHA